MWAITAEMVTGGSRAIAYLVFARLLSPGDFGVFALCVLLISLFPLLLDNTFSLSLIRHREEDQRFFSVIFVANVALSVAAVAVLCAAAVWLERIFHDRRIGALLPVLSIQLLFNSLGATHIALARRRFHYRQLLPVRLVSAVAGLAVGIPLAVLGYTYWALVAWSLAGACAQMLAAWAAVRWRPSIVMDWGIMRSIASFSLWAALDMTVTWMVMSGGGFFLAFYLGAHDLGIFRLSDQVDSYTLGTVLNPLIPVLYSAFCQSGAHREEWRAVFNRTSRAVGFLALLGAGAIVVSAHALEALVGPRWHGLADVIVLNAVADGVSFAVLPIPSLLRARGEARVVAVLRVLLLVGQVVVYSYAAPRGLETFVIGKIALECMMYAVFFGAVRGVLEIPVARLIGTQALQFTAVCICALLAAGAAVAVSSLGAAVQLVCALAVFAVPIAGYAWLVERPSLLWLTRSGLSAP